MGGGAGLGSWGGGGEVPQVWFAQFFGGGGRNHMSRQGVHVAELFASADQKWPQSPAGPFVEESRGEMFRFLSSTHHMTHPSGRLEEEGFLEPPSLRQKRSMVEHVVMKNLLGVVSWGL